jgi:NAD(P)-dependent dehydrogenase (short-subunit alcohol dehydrogenase family)
MIILITGSNRGLGLEFTKQYLARGEMVFGSCRKPNKAKRLLALKEEYPERLILVELDVSTQESIDAAYNQVTKKVQKIDILINNAGIRSGSSKRSPSFGDTITENMVKVFQTNVIAPIRIAERFYPLLLQSDNPKIINISSRMGSLALKESFHAYSYSSSKAALNMLSKQMALQLEKDNVVVNPIIPGHVRTDMGGPSAPLSPQESISGMIKVIDSLTQKDSGKFLSYEGKEYPW